jgi:hypothetical protein
VGAGHLGTSATALLSQTAAQLRIGRSLRLPGRVPDDELRRYYSSAAVCVQPSRYEGFGLQPLEALACGVPLVITPEAAVESVVGEAAVVASGASRQLLAEAISRSGRTRTSGPSSGGQAQSGRPTSLGKRRLAGPTAYCSALPGAARQRPWPSGRLAPLAIVSKPAKVSRGSLALPTQLLINEVVQVVEANRPEGGSHRATRPHLFPARHPFMPLHRLGEAEIRFEQEVKLN